MHRRASELIFLRAEWTMRDFAAACILTRHVVHHDPFEFSGRRKRTNSPEHLDCREDEDQRKSEEHRPAARVLASALQCSCAGPGVQTLSHGSVGASMPHVRASHPHISKRGRRTQLHSEVVLTTCMRPKRRQLQMQLFRISMARGQSNVDHLR